MNRALLLHNVRLFLLVVIPLFPFLSNAQDKIMIGLSSVSATNGSVWVAEDKGLFKKYGADVEVIVIGGGGARVVSSLVAGDIHFSVGGGEGSIRSQLKGVETVIVASTLTKGLQRILARPEIKAMLVGLDKGGADAAVLTMPTFFLAEEKGYRVVGDPANMDIFYLQNTLESTRAFLRNNRDRALKFMKGYIEGMAYFKKNKRESLDVMRKKLRIQSEQERDSRYLELSYNLLASTFYNEVPYPSLKGVQTILDKIGEEEPKVKERDAKSFVDDSFVKELDDSGFIKALYAR